MIKHMRVEDGVHTFKVNGFITLMVYRGEAKIHWHEPSQCEIAKVMLAAKSTRYTCTCDPGIINDENARFAQQVIIELPDNSLDKARRLKDGLLPNVCVDPCIVDAIKKLWAQGIETLGCCCGHNVMQGWVAVHPKDYEKMFKLGYQQRPVEVSATGAVMGLYTFYF